MTRSLVFSLKTYMERLYLYIPCGHLYALTFILHPDDQNLLFFATAIHSIMLMKLTANGQLLQIQWSIVGVHNEWNDVQTTRTTYWWDSHEMHWRKSNSDTFKFYTVHEIELLFKFPIKSCIYLKKIIVAQNWARKDIFSIKKDFTVHFKIKSTYA